MGIGAVAYLVFGLTPSLDGAATFFGPIFETILPLFMFLVLFVTFCKVDFRRLRPVGWHFWTGLFQLIFIVLIMATILISDHHSSALIPHSSFKILMEAILMCVICPCATAAAVVTQKLGGSLEQMTTYTFLSNFITVAGADLLPHDREVCRHLFLGGIHQDIA